MLAEPIRTLLALSALFFVTSSVAQRLAPQQVERNLYKSYNRLAYWDSQQSAVKYDSLEAANGQFSQLLQAYARQYPFTMQQSFARFKGLNVITSADGLLRAYSWDTWTGGTMHVFDHVFQYKVANATHTLVLPSAGEGDAGSYYPHIFTAKLNGKTYYLVGSKSIASSKDISEGIQVFAIENGKLNTDVRLIKTSTGLHSELVEAYNFFSVIDWKVRPAIRFNAETNTIELPLVDSKGNVTHQTISYKFTGEYFERVKN